MKKFFLMAVIALAATTAKAQLWVGGELGFYSTKTEREKGDLSEKIYENKIFTFKPELVYDLNENWSLGIGVGFYHNDNERTNTWSFDPFARYKFAEAGDVKFFIDGGVRYQSEHFNGSELDNAETYGVFFKPGLSYEISDNVCFDAHLGDLSYMFRKADVGGGVESKTNSFDLKAASAFTFGVYFKF